MLSFVIKENIGRYRIRHWDKFFTFENRLASFSSLGYYAAQFMVNCVYTIEIWLKSTFRGALTKVLILGFCLMAASREALQ